MIITQRDQQLIEQVLNLSIAKKDIIGTTNTNLLPENRVYRYDHFKDNCATRIRDLIESCYPAACYIPWGCQTR